ncbi:50S ribosome-binding GTPase [Streptomyces iconiensis]|uniref:50S ribosome-binding GTPase n=1 Tax=Streptomyces iconiensis TaxID=1384038 RepID=A0ABT7A7K8_9ACTN|nr:GTPase [Streptomyces iconiensis]MDJ1136618.1 50S ribosome-binding GTPase [Streptomyces iconiensis]
MGERADGHEAVALDIEGAGRSETAEHSGPAERPERVGRPERPEREATERKAGEDVLRQRLGALRELVGLSRTRLDGEVLAEAGRVLDAAAARRGLPRAYTTVALAGATGSGKSSLFNALTGARFSEVAMRRPTTAAPVSCTWEAAGADGADGLLDRLGIPAHARHRTRDGALSGLVLVDLPDHDSVAKDHREQVDRMLELVDAVVWVVDPEKYADAVLHEQYLRRLAGHAEVTFIVLNQTDRLTSDAVDAVLDDLRRLLDEDGMALGEHGEPGAAVLSASALTGEGVALLREELGEFVTAQRAAVLRLNADLDGAMERLQPVYADPGIGGAPGLTEPAREDFEDRLAIAVGAAAAGQAAERAWLRQAGHASATPWVRLLRRYSARTALSRNDAVRGEAVRDESLRKDAVRGDATGTATGDRAAVDGSARDRSAAGGASCTRAEARGTVSRVARPRESLQHARAARPVVAQAVRELADAAAYGLPDAWARTVRESARRGAAGLPEALDAVMEVGAVGAGRGEGARGGQAERAAHTGRAEGPEGAVPEPVPQPGSASRDDGAEPGDAAGADVHAGAGAGAGAGVGDADGVAQPRGEGTPRAPRVLRPPRAAGAARPSRPPRPPWWTAARVGQGLLLGTQVLSVVWAVAMVAFGGGNLGGALAPCALFLAATAGGPLLAWGCRAMARGPARAYGLEEERRLRRLAAGCGRTRVLEPVATELMRYREVREQYAIAAGVVRA